MSRRVLVFAYDAGRQGAPRVMLDMLTWFREHSDLEFEVVLHMGGPLSEDFRGLAPTVVLNPFLGSPRLAARIARALIPNPRTLDRVLARRFRRHIKNGRFDVVWMNSVASWKVADVVAPLGVPRVLHVHELTNVIRLVGPPGGSIASMADHFVAASAAVRDNLVGRHAVEPDRVSVVHSSIRESSSLPPTTAERIEGRERLGIGPDDYVIVGCGVGTAAKGVDLLPTLLAAIHENPIPANVQLIWVGRCDENLRRAFRDDLVRVGLAESLHFTGEVDDPQPLFSLGDVFVLPSREEAFPLVCLEAARSGLPTVCFADAGGAPEFVAKDAGVVVPYLDVRALAAALSVLGRDPELRMQLGRRAREKLNSEFLIRNQAPRFLEVLTRVVDSQHSASVPSRESFPDQAMTPRS